MSLHVVPNRPVRPTDIPQPNRLGMRKWKRIHFKLRQVTERYPVCLRRRSSDPQDFQVHSEAQMERKHGETTCLVFGKNGLPYAMPSTWAHDGFRECRYTLDLPYYQEQWMMMVLLQAFL